MGRIQNQLKSQNLYKSNVVVTASGTLTVETPIEQSPIKQPALLNSQPYKASSNHSTVKGYSTIFTSIKWPSPFKRPLSISRGWLFLQGLNSTKEENEQAI